MLWGSGCLFLAWFGDSFLKVGMRGLSCTNHFPVRWAWKRRCTPPFTFSLTKLRAPWLPFLALPMNFIHNLMYPKDTKNICAGTGHLTSFSHSLPLYLVSGSHPYSLTNYMIYFFFCVLVELQCHWVYPLPQNSQCCVFKKGEKYWIWSLL